MALSDDLNTLDLMRAAAMLQNPLHQFRESEGDEHLLTGPIAPHTGERTPASVEQSEGETPAVMAARSADRGLNE